MKTREYKSTYTLTLFIGDFLVWFSALWIGLFLRRLQVPTLEFYLDHAIPYLFVFFVWAIIAYSFGMYESKLMVLKNKFTSVLIQTQLYSAAVAVALFYLSPSFIVKPKITLFVILVATTFGIVLWRIFGVRLFTVRNREKSIYLATNDNSKEFFKMVNEATYYPLSISNYIDVDMIKGQNLISWVNSFVENGVRVIVLDPRSSKLKDALPELHQLIFEGVHFIDENEIYEDITEKIQLKNINHEWLIENISIRSHTGYDSMKRLMDIFVSTVAFVVTLPLYLPIVIAIKSESKGPALLVQERIGKNNKKIYIAKFRTMISVDNGVFVKGKDNRITKVGRVLRKYRLDELPQLVSIMVGDLSLIGPRPEASGLISEFNEKIPYFSVRHLITPGLSGWAQIHHETPPRTIEETADKLAFDLYYMKNRSVLLDLKIALKTLYTLVSKAGA